MSKTSLIQTLQNLTMAKTGRNETSRLRDVLPDIEQALASGVRRQAILDALHEDGFTMNMKTFEKALYRIRKKNSASSTITSTPLKPAESTATSPLREPTAIKSQGAAIQVPSEQTEKKPHPFAHLSEQNNPDWKHDGRIHNSVPDIDRIYGKKKSESSE